MPTTMVDYVRSATTSMMQSQFAMLDIRNYLQAMIDADVTWETFEGEKFYYMPETKINELIERIDTTIEQIETTFTVLP